MPTDLLVVSGNKSLPTTSHQREMDTMAFKKTIHYIFVEKVLRSDFINTH